jgi:DamX protein
MIAHVYRDTHGVPGRIIAEVSGLSGAKPGGKLKWILVLAVVSALAIAVGVQWLVSGQDKKVGSTPVAVEQKADVVEIVHPQPEAQIILPLPPAQPTIQPQQQQPVPAKESNEAVKPLAEINVGGVEQQLVIPAAKPEASSTIVIKPLPEQLEIQPEPVEAIGGAQETDNKQVAVAHQKIDEPSPAKSQEKPKQPELSKAVNAVKSLIPEKTQIKAQSEPVTAAGIVQKAENKQADVSNVKMAERLWAAQEKLKQSALSKAANGVGMAPDTSNNLETIQMPPKPEGIAGESDQQTTETRMPQNAETGAAPVSSANNFTLQLMVLSKQSSANGIVKKYPAMEPDFRIIKSMIRGQEKFILEYGSYADAASANKARESLPFEFRKALVRKIAR